MNRNELIRTVRDMIAAPSCCAELRDAGEKWLSALGTPGEKNAGAALLAEAKEDISTIGHTVSFFESEDGVRIFGKEQAAAMAAHARELKASGAKWCDCPACAACEKIMDNAELLA